MTARTPTALKNIIVAKSTIFSATLRDLIDSVPIYVANPGNGIQVGNGTAQDLVFLFDLDDDQTIIWDESESNFAFSADIVTTGVCVKSDNAIYAFENAADAFRAQFQYINTSNLFRLNIADSGGVGSRRLEINGLIDATEVGIGVGAGAAPVTGIMLNVEENIGIGGTEVIDSARTFKLRSYTVATLPAVGTAGGMIFVSDEAGGSIPAFSDGTNWRRVTDRAIVS